MNFVIMKTDLLIERHLTYFNLGLYHTKIKIMNKHVVLKLKIREIM